MELYTVGEYLFKPFFAYPLAEMAEIARLNVGGRVKQGRNQRYKRGPLTS
jgi:hypothetical protein